MQKSEVAKKTLQLLDPSRWNLALTRPSVPDANHLKSRVLGHHRGQYAVMLHTRCLYADRVPHWSIWHRRNLRTDPVPTWRQKQLRPAWKRRRRLVDGCVFSFRYELPCPGSIPVSVTFLFIPLVSSSTSRSGIPCSSGSFRCAVKPAVCLANAKFSRKERSLVATGTRGMLTIETRMLGGMTESLCVDACIRVRLPVFLPVWMWVHSGGSRELRDCPIGSRMPIEKNDRLAC